MGGLSGLSGLRGLAGLTARPAAAGGFDADAQTFFTDADITDATQRTAVNDLVVGLKANGTWSKYHAIYPLVGGTASRHSYNLKNPATFQITWAGTVTHNSDGVTGNGTNGTGDTGYIENTNSTANSLHLSCYSRSNFTAAATDIGTRITNPNSSRLVLSWTDNNTYYAMNSADFSIANVGTTGHFVVARTSSSLTKLYRNGAVRTTNTSAPGILQTAAYAVLSLPGAEFSNRNYALFTIGLGLTDSEVAADYTTIQAYQTTLSRQV